MITQSKIRLAQASDEPELLHLFRLMHAEGGFRKLSIDRVRATFARAFEKKGGILAVIGAPGQIRAMMFLLITQHFYTDESHIEELWNWVHPEHRRSDYSKLMIDYAKLCSDRISADSVAANGEKVPLIMGVLTNRRMSAKVRLYRRFFGWPVGAFFLYNAPWITKEDMCEEDIWKIPSIARRFFKHEDRAVREKVRARA